MGKIRAPIASFAAIMEKQMTLGLDKRVDLRAQQESKPFRDGLQIEAKRLLKMVREYEDEGNPEADLQAVFNQAANVGNMCWIIVRVLAQKAGIQ